MSTSRIPATRRSAPGDTANTRYDFTTCPVADAFRWGSYFTTHPAYSLSILHGYIRRMLDADEEGCEHCSKRHWDTIFQYTYWSRYMTTYIRQDRGASVLSEDRMHKFFRACIETVEDGCILWEHIRLLKPSCCAGRCSSQDESLEMTTSSPRWFSSSASSSVSKETVISSATQTPLSWSRNTSPKPEVTPTSSSPSPQVPAAKSDLVLFQPSKVNSLPVNSDWLSRLRKIFGFYWQKFIYSPFSSLYRWFWDTQANLLGYEFKSRLGLRAPTFYSFAPNEEQSSPQKLLEWPSSSSPPPPAATPSAESVVNNDDNRKETTEDQTPPSRMAKTKTREEVKDMWWKVMAKILLAEHRERREKEEVASTWERARSAASVTEGTSRPSSPISFVSSEGTDSSLRPEDCFSTVSGGSVHSEDDGEDEEAVQAASNDSSNPEFDEWYAEWFSQWVLETSRKLRSPESESRFSSYSISSSAASSVNGSDHHEEEVEGNASDEEEDINMIRTRPSTPTPFSSPIIIAVRGRDRYRRRLSLSGSSSSDSSPSPPTRRNSSIPPSSPAYRSPSRRRRRLPSPFCTTKGLPNPSSPIFRRRTPSPLNINHFPLPPSTLLSPVFPTASSPSSHPSSRSSSRSNSRPCCRSPSQSPSRSPSRPSSPLSSRPSSPTATQHFQVQDQWQHKGRPMNAKTEDYLSNAHLLRFPATVSARLMMTAETLGVAGEGKRKLVSELQRTPTVSEPVNEAKWRRASEEVKGFDWGFGMGSNDSGEEEGYERDEEGYETY